MKEAEAGVAKVREVRKDHCNSNTTTTNKRKHKHKHKQEQEQQEQHQQHQQRQIQTLTTPPPPPATLLALRSFMERLRSDALCSGMPGGRPCQPCAPAIRTSRDNEAAQSASRSRKSHAAAHVAACTSSIYHELRLHRTSPMEQGSRMVEALLKCLSLSFAPPRKRKRKRLRS